MSRQPRELFRACATALCLVGLSVSGAADVDAGAQGEPGLALVANGVATVIPLGRRTKSSVAHVR